VANEIDDSECTTERHAEARCAGASISSFLKIASPQTPAVSATATPTTLSHDDLNKLARTDGSRLAKAVKTTMVPAASA
jgi:hypothetical protein